METFELHKDYSFSTIEEITNVTSFETVELVEHGPELMGEYFVTLKDERANVVSFVLTGTSGNGYIMTCIYTDF